ncbi:MAG: type II secretion system protein [Rhodoferax sp.]|nr:type II secretion system protein [Rhodoferax sp.]
MPWQAGRRSPQRGFTLIELVMVIVLLGVLAVFAAPRIFNSNDFNARGFHDETLGFLRYAQKTAIAQRRTVCVTFSGTSGASLGVASAPATPTCDTALRGPRGDSPGTITAKVGVAYSGAPTSFNFDGLGQPVNAAGVLVATQIIQIVNAANVIVEAGTGYVHD